MTPFVWWKDSRGFTFEYNQRGHQIYRVIEVDAAQRLRASAAARVRQGVDDSRTELTATDSWIEQRDALLQLDAQALSTDIGLQRALGGGYERTKATP